MDATFIGDARWVRRGMRRKRALGYLARARNPMTATELGIALNVGMKKASETLRELAQRQLVSLLDPDRPFRRRYQITQHGKALATWLKPRSQKKT